MHKTLWTVVYPNGNKAYFHTREAARAEAVLHGISLIPPLYRSEA